MDLKSMLFELTLAYAPSINALTETACYAFKIWLLSRLTIIKPTS